MKKMLLISLLSATLFVGCGEEEGNMENKSERDKNGLMHIETAAEEPNIETEPSPDIILPEVPELHESVPTSVIEYDERMMNTNPMVIPEEIFSPEEMEKGIIPNIFDPLSL